MYIHNSILLWILDELKITCCITTFSLVTQILDPPNYNDSIYRANITNPIVKKSNITLIHYLCEQL